VVTTTYADTDTHDLFAIALIVVRQGVEVWIRLGHHPTFDQAQLWVDDHLTEVRWHGADRGLAGPPRLDAVVIEFAPLSYPFTIVRRPNPAEGAEVWVRIEVLTTVGDTRRWIEQNLEDVRWYSEAADRGWAAPPKTPLLERWLPRHLRVGQQDDATHPRRGDAPR
jgi:hypothetical protein